jgi:sec-independent protein translocase protein TatA
VGLGREDPLHIAIILVVVLLLFGAKKLPEMGRGLGQGMREFREGVTGRNVEQPVASVPEEVEERAAVPGTYLANLAGARSRQSFN